MAVADYHPVVGDKAVSDKAADLDREAEAWQRLHAVMYRITPEIAEVPGYFEEGWTAKDAVAHLGTWMAEGAQMLRRVAAGTYREGELKVYRLMKYLPRIFFTNCAKDILTGRKKGSVASSLDSISSVSAKLIKF